MPQMEKLPNDQEVQGDATPQPISFDNMLEKLGVTKDEVKEGHLEQLKRRFDTLIEASRTPDEIVGFIEKQLNSFAIERHNSNDQESLNVDPGILLDSLPEKDVEGGLRVIVGKTLDDPAQIDTIVKTILTDYGKTYQTLMDAKKTGGGNPTKMLLNLIGKVEGMVAYMKRTNKI